MVLELIDTMRDPSTDIDAWLNLRAFFGMRLAAGYFGSDRKEEGYAALERAVELYLKFAQLPDNTDLSYHCPSLDLLKVNKQKDLEYGASGNTVCREAYRILTEPAGWEWFNRVRSEVRYLAQVERFIPYLNESKSE